MLSCLCALYFLFFLLLKFIVSFVLKGIKTAWIGHFFESVVFSFCTGIWAINNVVIVEQWRDSAICIHVSVLPQTLLPSRLPNNIEQRRMFCTVGPRWYARYLVQPTKTLAWCVLDRKLRPREVRKMTLDHTTRAIGLGLIPSPAACLQICLTSKPA